MNKFTTNEKVDIFYEDQFFGEPWCRNAAETILLIHGTGESSAVWYAWVLSLATQFRVIRPDLPGYGQSRDMANAETYTWTTSRLAADLKQLIDALGVERLHVVGAKYGGSVAVEFAARYQDHVATLSVIGGPVQVQGQSSKVNVPDFADQIDRDIRKWADESMGKRLGSKVSAAQRQWWVDLMASSNPRATRECAAETARLDLLALLKQVKAPILFVTTNDNQLVLLEHYKRWIMEIAGASLIVLNGDDYHPAAMHPADCVNAVKSLIARAGDAGGTH